MNVLQARPRRLIALGLVVLLGVRTRLAFAAPQQAYSSQSNATEATGARSEDSSSSTSFNTGVPSGSAYPNSPGAQLATQPQAPAAQAGQQTSPAPVGTAAAPYGNPEGTPASRPAGAAIAPAKQRRARSFTIRTALLVGAAVAVGVVVAASLSSPARAN